MAGAMPPLLTSWRAYGVVGAALILGLAGCAGGPWDR
jgi:hypothetical protein